MRADIHSPDRWSESDVYAERNDEDAQGPEGKRTAEGGRSPRWTRPAGGGASPFSLLLTEELPPRVGVLAAPRNAVLIPPVEGQRQGPPEMRHFPSIAGSATLVIGHPPESREEPTPRPRGSMVLLFAFPRGKDEGTTPPNGPRTLRTDRGKNTVDVVP